MAKFTFDQAIDKWLGPLYRDIDDEPVDEDEDN
jgi:hypothetical protein